MSKKAYKDHDEVRDIIVRARLNKKEADILNTLVWVHDKSISEIIREALLEYGDRWL